MTERGPVPGGGPPRPWSELSSLVDALLDAPNENRAALIEELSAGDVARRAELERIVADFDRDAPLLARPVAERFAGLLAEDLPGVPDVLAERYRLTREVGRGGMAVVYLARDLKHARDVAVKVVRPALAAALGHDQFLREIEIVARLHHPHIVPLFDSGDADGVLYYVMPFETGMSLRERLARDGPLPIADAVAILRDVCDALAYAHERGIVHRDIKPDNVMSTGRHAMVTDFGVAKALAATVEPRAEGVPGWPATGTREMGVAATTGVAFGTPAYMAPEQITRDPHIDHRADIYAVGVLAYELVTGHPPFAGATRDAVFAAHLSETPMPLASTRADVPAALGELVTRCLAKRPEERWQSAEAILERLDRLRGGPGAAVPAAPRRRWSVALLGVAIAAAAGVVIWRRAAAPNAEWLARWANARIERLTDLPGSEVDAAISPNGQSVAFLAEGDSAFDALVTRVGSGRFTNLTGGRFPQLLNEDVRNVGFSGDGSRVWVRVADITSQPNVWLAPASGGPFQPFLEKAVMAVWSPDGARVAYHETTGGDPIYVADSSGRNPRKIFSADAGIHCHHLAWSPDGRYLYFSYGTPPNDMDIWRVPAAGGAIERVTAHDSKVGYPVLLDDRTLLYTATADDGTGPWLYSMDLARRVPERVLSGVEHYISIAASARMPNGARRLVATVSNPEVGLWSVPVTDTVAAEAVASRLALPTARAAGPRFAPDGTLLYLASRSGADAVWKLGGAAASELWKATDGAVVGPVAVSPDGSQLCAPVRRRARSTLFCKSASGTAPRALGESLDVRGAASWSPDGKWVAVSAKDGAGVRLFKVPIDGGPPIRLVDSVSSNPVWSPDGSFIVYSGTARARIVPLRAVTPDGRPHPLPPLEVDRVGDSYRFLPGGNALVVKLGGFRGQDFWVVDLGSGQRRRLTALRRGESLQRFDVSPDGKRIVFERVRENSDIALIALPER